MATNTLICAVTQLGKWRLAHNGKQISKTCLAIHEQFGSWAELMAVPGGSRYILDLPVSQHTAELRASRDNVLAIKQQVAAAPDDGYLDFTYDTELAIHALYVALTLVPEHPSQSLRRAYLHKRLAVEEHLAYRGRVSKQHFAQAVEEDPLYEDALVSSVSFIPFFERNSDLLVPRLQAASVVNPDSHSIYDMIADMYYEDGAGSRGLKYRYKSLLCSTPLGGGNPTLMNSTSPDDVLYHLLIANKLRASNEYQGAVEHYLSIVQSLEPQAELFATIGSCYYDLATGQQYAQEQNIARRLEHKKDTERADLRALIESRSVSRQPVDPQQAMNSAVLWMEQAVDNDPQDARFHSLLAQCLASFNPQRAADEYRRAIELNPVFGSALFGAAGLYGKATSKISLAEAVEWTESALKVSPDDPNYYFQLASLYHKAGREEEAVATFVKSLLCPGPLDEQHRREIEQMYCGS